ncbi:MAG TPA: hypothetical protein VMU61_12890 [Candidatus Aquilonibacter sp.]|nr:hypothetical protein [Candidatus Aquilonibacter sp.]
MSCIPFATTTSPVTIRISGKLSLGHLSYLDWLIVSAFECGLRVVLDLREVVEIDRAALFFLMEGEKNDFAIAECPDFIRGWMEHETSRKRA